MIMLLILLFQKREVSSSLVREILEKGRELRGLSISDAAILAACEDQDVIAEIFFLC